MPNLVLGSTTVISESGGTATLEIPIDDTTRQHLPKGVTQGVGFLLSIDDGGDSTMVGPPSLGTGDRIIVWDRTTNGLSDETEWANPITDLNSSGTFTLAVGYYYYKVCIPSVHQWQHWHLYGIREYGDSNGKGSELSNKSDNEISLGFTFSYAHSGNGTNDGLMSPGILKVTSAKQRYCIQYHNQTSSQHSWNGITVNTTTDVCIRSWTSFIKIG
tara:strand:+ start:158 stop:805 length:648 start_codon:yes stop_codon:yes gene_type:complete